MAAATAEAAVATAQAAVEIVRLSSRPSNILKHHHCAYAATIIQTAFRRYLVYIYIWLLLCSFCSCSLSLG